MRKAIKLYHKPSKQLHCERRSTCPPSGDGREADRGALLRRRPSKGGPQVRILDAAFSQEENRNAGFRNRNKSVGEQHIKLSCNPDGYIAVTQCLI